MHQILLQSIFLLQRLIDSPEAMVDIISKMCAPNKPINNIHCRNITIDVQIHRQEVKKNEI